MSNLVTVTALAGGLFAASVVVETVEKLLGSSSPTWSALKLMGPQAWSPVDGKLERRVAALALLTFALTYACAARLLYRAAVQRKAELAVPWVLCELTTILYQVLAAVNVASRFTAVEVVLIVVDSLMGVAALVYVVRACRQWHREPPVRQLAEHVQTPFTSMYEQLQNSEDSSSQAQPQAQLVPENTPPKAWEPVDQELLAKAQAIAERKKRVRFSGTDETVVVQQSFARLARLKMRLSKRAEERIQGASAAGDWRLKFLKQTEGRIPFADTGVHCKSALVNGQEARSSGNGDYVREGHLLSARATAGIEGTAGKKEETVSNRVDGGDSGISSASTSPGHSSVESERDLGAAQSSASLKQDGPRTGKDVIKMGLYLTSADEARLEREGLLSVQNGGAKLVNEIASTRVLSSNYPQMYDVATATSWSQESVRRSEESVVVLGPRDWIYQGALSRSPTDSGETASSKTSIDQLWHKVLPPEAAVALLKHSNYWKDHPADLSTSVERTKSNSCPSLLESSDTSSLTAKSEGSEELDSLCHRSSNESIAASSARSHSQRPNGRLEILSSVTEVSKVTFTERIRTCTSVENSIENVGLLSKKVDKVQTGKDSLENF